MIDWNKKNYYLCAFYHTNLTKQKLKDAETKKTRFHFPKACRLRISDILQYF